MKRKPRAQRSRSCAATGTTGSTSWREVRALGGGPRRGLEGRRARDAGDAARPRAGQLGAADRDRRRGRREWPPARARRPLLAPAAVEEIDEAEVGVQLMHDIDAVFERRTSPGHHRRTADRLHEMEERVWSAYGNRRPISGHQQGALLRQFGVRSRQLKIEVDGKPVNRHGFEREQFVHVLAQYPKKGATPPTFRRNPRDSFQPMGVGKNGAAVDAKIRRKPLKVARVAPKNGGRAGTFHVLTRPERLCEWCGGTLAFLSRKGTRYCSDSCRHASYASTEGGSRKKRSAAPAGGGSWAPSSDADLDGVAGGPAHASRGWSATSCASSACMRA